MIKFLNRYTIALVLLVLGGCSPTRKPDVVSNHNLVGILEPDKCDSLLFTSLAASSGQTQPDILQFRGDPGQWFRTVTHTCLDEGRSRSDISRDMFLGLFWYLHRTGNINLLKEIWDYGTKHYWKMGRDNGTTEGFVATVLPPSIIFTLNASISKLQGYQHSMWASMLSSTIPKADPGYTRHLATIHCLLRLEIGEGMDTCYEDMLTYVNEDPGHPLFTRAAQLFGHNPKSEPVRPTNRCRVWPIEHPLNHEAWQPCGILDTYDYYWIDSLKGN